MIRYYFAIKNLTRVFALKNKPLLLWYTIQCNRMCISENERAQIYMSLAMYILSVRNSRSFFRKIMTNKVHYVKQLFCQVHMLSPPLTRI